MTFLDTTQFECRNRECLQKSSSPGEDLPLPPPPPLNTTVSSTSSGSDGPATSLGMISHKKSVITVSGHNHKFKNFTKKI